MKKCFTSLFCASFLAILGSAAVTGCSSSPAKTGDGGAGGTGAGSAGVELVVGPTGFVQDATTGITGSWYAYGDGIGPDGTSAAGDCVKLGGHTADQCSMITAPSFGMFPQDVPGTLCTSGMVAQIINITGTTMPDYNNIWGAGIGLDLNNMGGDAGVRMPYDAPAHGVTGIAFDIDGLSGIPLDGLRVEFVTTSTEHYGAPFWGGDLMKSPVKAGHNEFHWADVKGPFYYQVAGVASPAPPFEKDKILSMQFHAIPGTGGASPYHFCLSHVTALGPTAAPADGGP